MKNLSCYNCNPNFTYRVFQKMWLAKSNYNYVKTNNNSSNPYNHKIEKKYVYISSSLKPLMKSSQLGNII